MTWLSANAGTILVLVILVVLVGLVIRNSCVSADACSIHAAGKSCGNPHDRVADMEPQVKKVK